METMTSPMSVALFLTKVIGLIDLYCLSYRNKTAFALPEFLQEANKNGPP